jgi:hypothetical protein
MEENLSNLKVRSISGLESKKFQINYYAASLSADIHTFC